MNERTYCAMLISRTSKENKNLFDKSRVREIGGKITEKFIQEKRVLGSRNREV